MFEQKNFNFIYKYFIAEKQESLLFLIIGIVAIMLAFIFLFLVKNNESFFKGASIPLLAIGMIQMVVGYTVYARTDKQKIDIAYNIGIEPVAFTRHTELPRMKKVMKSFIVYRWGEITFLITGLVLIFCFRSKPDKTFWYGFGLTLAIQAVLMLGADYFAEKRGKDYSKSLEEIVSIN